MSHLPKPSILFAGLMLCVLVASTNAQDAGPALPVLPEPSALETGNAAILPVPQPEPKAAKPKKKKRGLFRRWFAKDDRPEKPSRPATPPRPGPE